jgi:RNA 3'-terminal phosphate cyclase (ATP)
VIAERLSWPSDDLRLLGAPEPAGPGNAVLLELRFDHITELFSSIGEVGKPAELVAQGAVDEARDSLGGEAPAGPHLADRLLLPMALAGSGSFAATCLTPHAATNIDTIRAFLDVEIAVAPGHGRAVVISVGGCSSSTTHLIVAGVQ